MEAEGQRGRGDNSPASPSPGTPAATGRWAMRGVTIGASPLELVEGEITFGRAGYEAYATALNRDLPAAP